MKITLLWSPAARDVREWTLALADGCTVAQALDKAQQLDGFPAVDEKLVKAGSVAIGIWGKRTIADQVLQDGDRLELYRDLRVDPKVARRERFNRQGAKGTGLFAKTRPGSKAGY
ncbi:MAG: RnfH family protein [Pseudomonadota bacterium]